MCGCKLLKEPCHELDLWHTESEKCVADANWVSSGHTYKLPKLKSLLEQAAFAQKQVI